jgi:L-asparaginase
MQTSSLVIESGPDTVVRVLTTGGTISSRPAAGGVQASDGPAEVLAGVAVDGVRLEATEVMRTGGYRMSEGELRQVAAAVLDAVADAPDGVVVTHGTDTMEETAFLTDLVHGGPEPVVFCGAQRNAAEPDRDGPRNVTDAVRLAAAPPARGLGTMICMAGRAWPARHAVKAHTLALDAFCAPGTGELASVWGADVRVLAQPARRAALPAAVLDRPLARVDLIPAYAGCDGALVDAALSAGARGLVVMAFGTGNLPPGLAGTLIEALAAGVPVLVASRCADGPTVPLYGGPGGALELARAGAMFAGQLRASHARLLLSAALGCAAASTDVHELVAPWTR